jgi:hypothetical protein
MIDERRVADTAAKRAVGAIPAATQREIRQRAATLGLTLEMSEDGREVRVALPTPPADEAAASDE